MGGAKPFHLEGETGSHLLLIPNLKLKMIPKRIISDEFVAVKKCRYGYFAYNKNDLFIGRSLDLYGEWSQPEMDLLDSFINPSNIICDIGAYIGTHSIFFAKKVAPTGTVIAIEPQRSAFELLNANLALNSIVNTIAINAFASDKKEKVAVPLLNPYVKQNFGALRISRFKEGEIVSSITIDDLYLKNCHLIKIDTEENEDKIIKGAQKTIKKFKPILYVENNETEDAEKIIKAVIDLGYHPFWHIFHYFNPQNFFRNKKNVFAKFAPEANMICFPKKPSHIPDFLEPVTDLDDNWQKALKRINLPRQNKRL